MFMGLSSYHALEKLLFSDAAATFKGGPRAPTGSRFRGRLTSLSFLGGVARPWT